MLNPKATIDLLCGMGISFFTGVPDSLLAPFCRELEDNDKITHITAANEGNAVALACGYNLATGLIPLIYMQNSGIGNAVNPLLSLMDKRVYSVPALYLIGWRGEPGIKDEPQHITQGLLSEQILETLGLKYNVITPETDSNELERMLYYALKHMNETGEPYAFLVKKNSFIKIGNKDKVFLKGLLRREAINIIVDALSDNAVIVSTTGKTSRELYEIRNKRHEGHSKDFLTVGSMGHSSQIALAVSLFKKDVTVCCIDGEGAVLMHMGALAVNGALAGNNFIHILINNGAHDSVGGQPNFGKGMDFSKIALECGYKNTYRVNDAESIAKILKVEKTGSTFLQIDVELNPDENLSRPAEMPVENKGLFMSYLSKFGE